MTFNNCLTLIPVGNGFPTVQCDWFIYSMTSKVKAYKVLFQVLLLVIILCSKYVVVICDTNEKWARVIANTSRERKFDLKQLLFSATLPMQSGYS